jgi:hypothetical protein
LKGDEIEQLAEDGKFKEQPVVKLPPLLNEEVKEEEREQEGKED